MKSINFADGRELSLDKPRIMGIINCTPDSFAVRSATPEIAIADAQQMIAESADLLDIGGESSRPGAEPVPIDEELRRIIPVIESIRGFSNIPISVDTNKAAVAEKALEVGADIINDISALQFDPEMVKVAAAGRVPVILMHMKGIPRTMQEKPHYDDVLGEIAAFFEERMAFAEVNKIPREKIILDVGIGFGKRLIDNLTLLKNLSYFKKYGRPLLTGASRKRFIGDITGKEVHERLSGSLAAAVLAVSNGADIVRVHDVTSTKDAVAVAAAMREV